MHEQKEVVVYIAMSLDGYIADAKGGVHWLCGDGSDENNEGTYPKFMETVDTILLGYTTYHQIISELSPNAWPYAGKQCYVFTHKPLHSKNGIFFVQEDIQTCIRKLKQMGGKNIWVCGGASIINQCMALKLVDEYTISIIPTILGEGIRLFTTHDKHSLQLISTTHYNGIVDVTYRYKT